MIIFRRLACVGAVALVLTLLSGAAGSRDAASEQYRLIAPSPASIAAVIQSPVYTSYVAGGSGQAIGISASPTFSNVAGNTSNQLPTARIFTDGMESP